MKTQSIDTHLSIEKMQFDALRRMTPRQKLEGVTRLNRLVERCAAAGLRRRYPHASEEEIAMRVRAQRIGPERVKRFYGWDFTGRK